MISENAQQRLVRLAMVLITKWGNYSITYTPTAGGYKYFRMITESWGIKFSRNPANIELNYDGQLAAWKRGLGPYCFGYTEIPNFFNNSRFYETTTLAFYVTETVPVLSSVMRDYCVTKDWEKKLNYKYWLKKIHNFFDYYYQNGNWFDEKANNLGLKDGRVICIDFDTA